MEKEFIYEALFCDGPESGYVTISIHKTKAGAQLAIKKNKEEEKKKWLESLEWDLNDRKEWAEKEPDKFKSFKNCTIEKLKRKRPFMRFRSWDIAKTELLN